MKILKKKERKFLSWFLMESQAQEMTWCHLHPLPSEAMALSCHRCALMSPNPFRWADLRLSLLSTVLETRRDVHTGKWQRASLIKSERPPFLTHRRCRGGGRRAGAQIGSECLCKGRFQLLRQVLFQLLPPGVASRQRGQLFS